MKRKVIQIAGSTQLISLPRQWAKAHNILRGAEIDVLEDGDKIIVSSNGMPSVQVAELDISNLNDMSSRCIRALYKKGVDELKVTFSNPEMAYQVQDAIAKEAVGFEILEQGQNYCVIKYVSGPIEEFDSLLRRIFLLLLNMAEDAVTNLKKGTYVHLKNVAMLEEANNRFTIVCRRALNKKNSAFSFAKLGPIYYIVEELEHVADEYKYICHHFSNLNPSIKLNKEAIGLFESASKLLRVYYDLFYKFDPAKVVFLRAERNRIVDEAHNLFKKKLSHADYWLVHHSIDISNRAFCLLGPYLVLAL